MLIGVPKEIKNHEYRVGLTPAAVKEFVVHGHQVLVEDNAGAAIGFTNEEFVAAGAEIAPDAATVFAKAEMIVKVKEPQENECKMLRKGQTLYTYLHLAPDPKQTELLIASGATCIAYETVTDNRNALPLLAPMSEVAGRMAVQAGAHYLEKAQGGSGTLLGGVPGVAPGKVLIIGGGVVGTNSAKMALGLGADVTILDRSLPRLRELDDIFDVHYCVANMPGGVARTSTMALNNAILPFGLALANKGPKQAMLDDAHLLNGLNVHEGKITYKAVVDALGESMGLTYTDPKTALSA